MGLCSLRRHRLPLPLPLLLAVLFAASRGDPSGDGYNTSICKLQLQPYTCGEVDIHYPFYLSGETADVLGNSNSSCGYPGLAIDCVDGEYPTMQLGGGGSSNTGYSYNVTGINYSSFTVSLADPDVLDDESCPRVDHNVTPSFWLNLLPEYTVRYLLFFANCSISTLPVPDQPNIQPIACASYGVDAYSFVVPSEVPYQPLSLDCKQVIQVPVLQNASVEVNSQWNTIGYSNILKQGFQLQLNLSRRSEECTKCERSSGRCAYSSGGEFEACLCTNGRAHDQDCTNGDGKALPVRLSCITFPISLVQAISLRLHHFVGSS